MVPKGKINSASEEVAADDDMGEKRGKCATLEKRRKKEAASSRGLSFTHSSLSPRSVAAHLPRVLKERRRFNISSRFEKCILRSSLRSFRAFLPLHDDHPRRQKGDSA